MSDSSTPLDGIRVVALEHAIAAPLCTRQLAELGARVIKVERRLTGDFARHYDTRVRGDCSHFVWTNRCKQSITLDLKKEAGLEILHKLLAGADVFVQNLAPTAAAGMGLSYERLRESYPALIVCNISGYGDSGPYANRKAYDLLVQAEAGFLSITGTTTEMVKSGISIADIAAGMQAQAAILAALIKRARTSRGCRIDISMLESMVEWMGFPLYYAYDGAPAPTRTGADHASIYPYGVFRTGSDGSIMLGLQNEREWQVFCHEVLQMPALATDSRFVDNALRSTNREALRDIIEQNFSQSSARQVSERLTAAGIACANVNAMAAVWQHPQLMARQRLTDIDTPHGKVKSFRPPGDNSTYQARTGPVPALGEHTESILEELGFSQDEIDRLRAREVI